MEKRFSIKVDNKPVEIIKGTRIRCTFRDGEPEMVGTVTELNFEYDGKMFFYLLCDDGEDYQISDEEIDSISQL